MTHLRLLPIAVALLVASGCGAPPASETPPATEAASPDPAAVRAAIEATEREWSAAFRAADAAAIAALYAEDGATVTPAGDWNRGREAMMKEYQAQFDTVNVATREDITEEVTLAGDYALEIGHYSWTGTAKKDGASIAQNGRYMVFWKKGADGKWMLYRDLGAENLSNASKKP